jgi:hypothetical protein
MTTKEAIHKTERWARNAFAHWKNRLNKWTRRFYPEQHQLTSTTAVNRYPELFMESSRITAECFHGENLNILSFGCSTGEECFSISTYFSEARIVGVDINKTNIMLANQANTSDRIKFVLSSQATVRREGKYHVIFCLSVLCRWEDTKGISNCESVYPFEKFEKTVAELAAELLPAGLLVIYNSNFRFEDTACFDDFEIVEIPSVPDSGFVDKFDSSNMRIEDEVHRNCIYRKK